MPPDKRERRPGQGAVREMHSTGDGGITHSVTDAAEPPIAPGQAAADLIQRTAAAAPRSLQAELGPSEAGEPCTRRLAYKILDWPKVRVSDPWAAVQGVAVHAWLADAFRAENDRLGRQRYLVEHRVEPLIPEASPVPGGLAGSCDLFDRDTGTVADWKLTSPAQLRRYAASGPGPKYRAQAHLYGLGLQRAGETVATVSIVFLPRATELDPVHVWSEPFSPQIAAAAVTRLQAIRDAITALDPETHPDRWGLFPPDFGSCRHCPWLRPGTRHLATGCPGRLDDDDAPSSVSQLIA